MSNIPLISVIIPVHNEEKFVAEAIGSVLDQRYSNWELLVINDGSTDKSKEVILSIKDPRIAYHEYNENRGVSMARNLGLAKIKGDYFCFLDADDIYPKNSLESRLKVFKEHPNLQFVDGAVEVYDKTFEEPIRLWRPDFKGNPLRELARLTGSCFFGPTWMVRRNKLRQLRFKPGLTHAEDLLFFIDLASYGGQYDYTRDSILRYRKGPDTAMSNLPKLEQGYREVYNHLLKLEILDPDDIKQYERKVRSIMTKSYLRNGNLFSALRSFIRQQ